MADQQTSKKDDLDAVGKPAVVVTPPDVETAQKSDAQKSEGAADLGYYTNVEYQFADPEKTDVYAVVFRRSTKPGPVPTEMREVTARVNAVVTVIRERFFSHSDKESWLNLIGLTARLGTVGPYADPRASLNGIKRVEDMLIKAARPLRTTYILQIFGAFLLTLAAAALIYLLFLWKPFLDILGWLPAQGADFVVNLVRVQLMTIAGLSVGIFFSGMSQNRVLSYERLEHFDPDGFSSFERLLYVWIVATVLEALLYFKVLTIGLGGQNFDELTTRHWLGFLIGLITAISTEFIVNAVTRASQPTTQGHAAKPAP
tara:strand:+ start:1516 stop:2460 length:945 start_codon:yes stop_codon:yes gene_type:complete